MGTIKRTSHAVYDTKYHLVWTPKYRKWILRGDIRKRVKEVFEEIATNHEFEIDEMEIVDDHVHIFLSFPPRYSIAKVVGMLKSISASVKWSNGNGHLEKSDRLLERCSNDRREEKELYPGIQA